MKQCACFRCLTGVTLDKGLSAGIAVAECVLLPCAWARRHSAQFVVRLSLWSVHAILLGRVGEPGRDS